MATSALLTIFALPLLWTALVAAFFWRPSELPAEADARNRLLLMLLPAPIGALCLLLAALLPVTLPTAGTLPPAWIVAPSLAGDPTASGALPNARDLSSTWAWAFFVVYGVGVAGAAGRLWAAQRRLRGLADDAHATPDLGAQVVVTHRPVTPFAMADHRIVLPRVLVERLSRPQIDLIVAHEQSHIHRKDPAFFTRLAWADAIFWFNPFLLRQTRRCRLAAELAVDAAVTGGRPADRKIYAASLIEALKHTAWRQPSCAPSVFSSPDSKDMKMRIHQILHRTTVNRNRNRQFAALAALVLPLALVQWTYAETGAGASAAFTVVPLEGKITSAFGELPSKRNGRKVNHRGVDIKAPHGTAIKAPAAGRVTRVQKLYKNYGNLLTIAHAGGFVTRYAHLSAFEVKVGDVVRAGTVIARVGSTGKSTGPHLHFEVLKDGEPIDPAKVAPLP